MIKDEAIDQRSLNFLLILNYKKTKRNEERNDKKRKFWLFSEKIRDLREKIAGYKRGRINQDHYFFLAFFQLAL